MSGLLSRMYEMIRSSSSARSRISSAWAVSLVRCGSSTHAHQRERKCGRSRPVFHATEQHPGQGHPPGVRRAGALHPGDGASHQKGPIIGPPLHSIRPRRQRNLIDRLMIIW